MDYEISTERKRLWGWRRTEEQQIEKAGAIDGRLNEARMASRDIRPRVEFLDQIRCIEGPEIAGGSSFWLRP